MRSDRQIRVVPKRNDHLRLLPRPADAERHMHQITFCIGCDEAIPVHALTCFRCGTKQPGGERALQVVFCEKCGRDYPARAMSCYHCGHINPRHPYLKGHYGN
jgi:ribosomal protein L40E